MLSVFVTTNDLARIWDVNFGVMLPATVRNNTSEFSGFLSCICLLLVLLLLLLFLNFNSRTLVQLESINSCLIPNHVFTKKFALTLSRRRPLSYRNQSIDLQSKWMDWFLYDKGLRLQRVNHRATPLIHCFYSTIFLYGLLFLEMKENYQ